MAFILTLDYCPGRKIYVRRNPDIGLPPQRAIEVVLRIASDKGIRQTGGAATVNGLVPGCLSSIQADDLPMVLGPAHILAGEMIETSTGLEWGDGEPLFIGVPRFRLDGAALSGAFPLGFWGREWAVEMDYVLIEKGLLRSICEEALRRGTRILAWRVSKGLRDCPQCS